LLYIPELLELDLLLIFTGVLSIKTTVSQEAAINNRDATAAKQQFPYSLSYAVVKAIQSLVKYAMPNSGQC
jgi:hypothetical protein